MLLLVLLVLLRLRLLGAKTQVVHVGQRRNKTRTRRIGTAGKESQEATVMDRKSRERRSACAVKEEGEKEIRNDEATLRRGGWDGCADWLVGGWTALAWTGHGRGRGLGLGRRCSRIPS